MITSVMFIARLRKISFSGFIHAVFFARSPSPIDETRSEIFPRGDIKNIKSLYEMLGSYIGKEIP
jgi:hypothetical protein